MIGKTVVLFLKSPLYIFSRGEDDGSKATLPRGIVQLRGEVLREKGPGLWMRLSQMGQDGDSIDAMRFNKDLLIEEVYIPFAKIDSIIFP